MVTKDKIISKIHGEEIIIQFAEEVRYKEIDEIKKERGYDHKKEKTNKILK